MENEKIEQLINEMTIEEKLAQMTQLAPFFFHNDNSADLTGPLGEINMKQEHIKDVGSTLNALGAENLINLQNEYIKNNRLKIPMLFMADLIYGYKTVFPIPLALGCSFNPDCYKTATEVTAKEGAVSGIHLTFAPMADLVRDPRWGRVMESTGEDPYLNSVMVKAAVNGFQGENPKNEGKLASCVKHFAAYGLSEAGRDYNTVDLSKSMLFEYYLPAYKAAVDAGVKMVMTSFNFFERIPASASKTLFREILRDKWGFTGTVISDYAAVDETITHGYAKDGMEAAKACIEAGVDIEMMSTHYLNFGKELVEKNLLSIDIIDDAVRSILHLKNELGLFENPYKDADIKKEKEILMCSEHRQKARDVAAKSIVLLKNTGVLPLKKGIKVGIAGPFAKSEKTMGGWAIANKDESVDLETGISEKISMENVKTAMSSSLGSLLNGISDVEDAICEISRLKDCDVLVAAVGENTNDTGEGASKTNLRLTSNQEKMIFEMKKLGKPIIIIVFSGRPLELKPVLDSCDALIQAWFLGAESGNAIADILFGDYNPSARLSMSFPQTVGQIPIYYNHFNSGRPANGKTERYISRYLDCPNEPLFCFGYGLSYSNFKYFDFSILQKDGNVEATVKIYNDSDVDGVETAQLYIRDIAASVIRPVAELKGFVQVEIKARETKTIIFDITKEMLKFYDSKLDYIFQPGEFEIMIGRNSSDVLKGKIFIKE